MENKTPLDLAKQRIKLLLDDPENNEDPESENERKKLTSFFMEMIKLLEEFTIKKRWLAYCYHVKDFVE